MAVRIEDEQAEWFRGSIDMMNDLLSSGKSCDEMDGYDVAKNIADELDVVLFEAGL